MTDETLLAYADLRARKLMLNGAQAFAFRQKALELWTGGVQAETALAAAAEEVLA